jgi:anthranilate phosphoribosyltransferase
VFNFLGPLAHPAKPAAQAIGCADVRMAPRMAGVFARRGVDAWVFRGDDGLDELTTTTTSRVWAVRAQDPELAEFTVDPDRFGLGGGTTQGLRGRDAAYNAEVVRSLVAGEPGQVRDAVLLNAGAALAVHADETGGFEDRLAVGIDRARASLDEGQAAVALERWVALSASR